MLNFYQMIYNRIPELGVKVAYGWTIKSRCNTFILDLSMISRELSKLCFHTSFFSFLLLWLIMEDRYQPLSPTLAPTQWNEKRRRAFLYQINFGYILVIFTTHQKVIVCTNCNFVAFNHNILYKNMFQNSKSCLIRLKIRRFCQFGWEIVWTTFCLWPRRDREPAVWPLTSHLCIHPRCDPTGRCTHSLGFLQISQKLCVFFLSWILNLHHVVQV